MNPWRAPIRPCTPKRTNPRRLCPAPLPGRAISALFGTPRAPGEHPPGQIDAPQNRGRGIKTIANRPAPACTVHRPTTRLSNRPHQDRGPCHRCRDEKPVFHTPERRAPKDAKTRGPLSQIGRAKRHWPIASPVGRPPPYRTGTARTAASSGPQATGAISVRLTDGQDAPRRAALMRPNPRPARRLRVSRGCGIRITASGYKATRPIRPGER